MTTPALQQLFGKRYKPDSRWKRFRRWLHEMDRRFLWKRVIIIFDRSSVSMAAMDKLPFARMRLNAIVIRTAFPPECGHLAIYDVDKLPRMKFEQLQKLIWDAMPKEDPTV